MRDYLLRSAVLAGVAVTTLTELLSLFHRLSPWPVALSWIVVLTVWIGSGTAKPPATPRRPHYLYFVTAIVTLPVLVAALVSPPNSADAMAYHLPRVIYWMQQGSIAFFPTPYYNQVMLQPLAEYCMLHTYLLTGGDHLINLVAFFAYIGSIVGVSAIAAALNLSERGQAIAAFLCATLPNAILQASGAKNDFLLALWLVGGVYFALRRNLLFLSLAIALALFTKATAYLFVVPLLLYAAYAFRRRAIWIAAAALAVNGAQYGRNIQLSGSPLGYDSAQGNGYFRWRNEHPDWKSLLSNALRHTSEQLGARSPKWNEAVYRTVLGAHVALGLDPNDPDTTWRGSHYDPPINANHEANANNRWHLLLFVIAATAALFTRNRPWTLYSAGLLTAFLLFCLYLKWQPFLSRLELPLFVLAAALGAWLLDRWPNPAPALIVCAFLLAGARLPLLQNWTRPLTGPRNLFVTRRDESYFNDMTQWHNRDSYFQSVDLVSHAGCNVVGNDITENQLEYPFQALLRERNPRVWFFHSMGGILVPRRPCAIWCPDCLGNEQKLRIHSGTPITIGRFLVWLK